MFGLTGGRTIDLSQILKELLQLTKFSFFISINLLAFLALQGQMRDPDLPRFQSVSTNLLNPYSTWLYYGCAWNHCGGPYSIMWYWTMIALSFAGRLTFTWPLFALNLLVQFLVRSRRFFYPYTLTSFFFLVAWPQNMVILFLLVWGFYSQWGTVLAPLFKLPIGALPYV